MNLSVRFLHSHFVRFFPVSGHSGRREPPAERSALYIYCLGPESYNPDLASWGSSRNADGTEMYLLVPFDPTWVTWLEYRILDWFSTTDIDSNVS